MSIGLEHGSDFSTANNESENTEWKWLLDMSELEPGRSAILDHNKYIFYTIHCCGLVVIVASVICCALVIFSICKSSKKVEKWDFSDRFPLYLALTDILWGLSNLFADHVILMYQQVFPEKHVASMLALNVSFFFGYQQLMNAGLSLYTYLRVVRRVSLDLGSLEWKLHAFVIIFLIANIMAFWSLDAYGNSGFWFLADLKTTWGKVLGANICITCTIHATLTFVAYRSIQKVINKQKRVVSMHIGSTTSGADNETLPYESKVKKRKDASLPTLKQNGYHSTANNCLTTFVYISLFLYFPLAVNSFVFLAFGYLGYVEPFNTFSIVLLANIGGFLNGLGYFHNKAIKEKRINDIRRIKALASTSSSSNV